MSVGSVTNSSLQRDLLSALRQTRAAAAQPVAATAFSAAGQTSTGPGTATAGATAPAQSGGTASSPALSSDLMASLLQIQSDASQITAQGGLPASVDSTGADDAGSGAGDTAPVRRPHGHHGRPTAETSGATDASQSGSGTALVAASATGSAGTGASGSLEDGLQALLTQITKAITAYASGGPAGLAASALTGPTKA